MLQSMNSGMNFKILRVLFGGLLLAALAGLVLTDVGGFFGNGGLSRSDLAKVGKAKLTVQQFDPLYRRQLQSVNMTQEQARQMGLVHMVLQQEITRQSMLQAASRTGIHVSNTYVADHLKRELKNIPSVGTDRDKLDSVLRNVGMSEREFVEALRGDTAAQILSSTIADTAQTVPDIILKSVASAKTQQRRAEIITIDDSALPDIKKADDATLKAYLNTHRERYEIAEQRDIAIAVMKQDKLLPKITVSDSDIEKYYNSNQDVFKLAARSQFTQAIAPDEATAKAVYDDAQKTSLTDAATKHKARLVAQNWYEQSTLPDNVDKAVFKEQNAKLIAPVQSPLGWHVIQTSDFKPASVKELSAVKTEIVDLLRQETTDKAINDLTQSIEQDAADGIEIAKIIEPYNGSLQRAKNLNRMNIADKIAALSVPQDAVNNVLDAAFALNDGDVSPIIESKDGSYILVQIEKISPAHLPEFSAAKSTLEQDWLKDQKNAALDKEIDDVIGDYNAKKPNLKVVAAEQGLPYRETGLLKPDSKELPAEVLNILFNLSPRNDLTSVKTDKAAYVVRLAAIETDNGDKISISEQDKADMRTALTQELQQQFILGWRDYLGVTVNDKLLNQVYMQDNQD
jgi:peptidyl-prolyl cis-trans isomerase D